MGDEEGGKAKGRGDEKDKEKATLDKEPLEKATLEKEETKGAKAGDENANKEDKGAGTEAGKKTKELYLGVPPVYVWENDATASFDGFHVSLVSG